MWPDWAVFKVLGNEFSNSNSPNISGCFENATFKVKTTVTTFLATFMENWANFILTSGHSAQNLGIIIRDCSIVVVVGDGAINRRSLWRNRLWNGKAWRRMRKKWNGGTNNELIWVWTTARSAVRIPNGQRKGNPNSYSARLGKGNLKVRVFTHC